MSCMSIVYKLSHTLPKENIITGAENTRPFECDGLSMYRQNLLAVVLPDSISQIKQTKHY